MGLLDGQGKSNERLDEELRRARLVEKEELRRARQEYLVHGDAPTTTPALLLAHNTFDGVLRMQTAKVMDEKH